MPFLLSSQNVSAYLVEQKICPADLAMPAKIEAISCKNFNLVVSFADDLRFLVKQEPHDADGKADGEFWHEWLMQLLLQNFAELQVLEPLITKATYFDPTSSILVFDYLEQHQDLSAFYQEQPIFVPAIANQLGTTLATFHRTTFEQERYHKFLQAQDAGIDATPNFLYGLEKLKPEVLGAICLESLDFFRLFQRYDSLSHAIAQLEDRWQSCCLIHADLKLSNVLLDLNWQAQSFADLPTQTSKVRLIDWEKLRWGDPAYDLANLIADYLKFWLNSLMISPAIDLETSLRFASIPLETIQPSLLALVQSYLVHFPAILHRFPDFLDRVVQYTGYMLIERLRIKLEYHGSFGNREICVLQIAKNLLGHPHAAMPLIFGTKPSI